MVLERQEKELCLRIPVDASIIFILSVTIESSSPMLRILQDEWKEPVGGYESVDERYKWTLCMGWVSDPEGEQSILRTPKNHKLVMADILSSRSRGYLGRIVELMNIPIVWDWEYRMYIDCSKDKHQTLHIIHDGIDVGNCCQTINHLVLTLPSGCHV